MEFQPEIIKGDPLFELIVRLVVEYKPSTILEIGSANGQGSTQAFIKGIEKAGIGNTCKMICLEMHPDRFKELVSATREYPFIECINASSIPVDQYMRKEQVEDFMETHGYGFNIVKHYNIITVKKWREDEIYFIMKAEINQNGIDRAIECSGVNSFDMVLIDGSAFTAKKECEKIMGAKIIILDDTKDIKNWNTRIMLAMTGIYSLIEENSNYRNGYSAFINKDVV